METSLKKLLKGMRPNLRCAQSLDGISIVPLTCDREYSLDSRFENPNKILLDTARGYGAITFHNNTDMDIVVMPQSAYLTDYHAQDHAVNKACYIKRRSTLNVDDANCVQSNQAGVIQAKNEGLKRVMLPFHLKEKSFDAIGNQSYSKLWNSIGEFNQSMDAKENGECIVDYFRKYEKRLDQFIAHFECPSETIGVAVIADEEIVAIEKFPSFTYARQVWDSLIRDTYGALVLDNQRNEKTTKSYFADAVASTRNSRNDASVVDMLERAYIKTVNGINKTYKNRFTEIIELSFDVDSDHSESHSDDVTTRIVRNDGYIGHIVYEKQTMTRFDANSDDVYYHMVSLVKKNRFDPESIRVRNKIRQKARGQADFAIF